MRHIACAFALLCAASGALAAPPASVQFTRVASGTIVLDGKLDEPAWSKTPALTRFFEIFPGNNTPPHTATAARFLFDGQALYVGVRMLDPDPVTLRTQFVERDQIAGSQDYVFVYIDALGSGHGAQFFVANVRGVQTDGHYSEANATEDDAPDYHWQVATSHDAHGWTAEFRIPFSTLRHVADGSRWKVLVYRARPRANYVQDVSAPIARGANCFVCFFNPVTGLAPPPPHASFLVAPEMVARTSPAGGGLKTDLGATAQWLFGGGRTLDVTVNPDFSEVEADAIQVTGNARFAQSLPEKRRFFMESLDLLAAQPQLDHPLQAIYTRNIADPDVGIRFTQRTASQEYTAFIARDAGGGSLLLPGPYITHAAAVNQSSNDLIARYVQNMHDIALGGVLTDREYQDGGYNRVTGMDTNWHPTQSDNVNAEFLSSATHDATGSPAANLESGARESSYAGYAKWEHLDNRWAWDALLQQIGDGFRADLGFVPATGFREIAADLGRRWFDIGAFNEIRPTLGVEDVSALADNATIVRSVYPGLYVLGPHSTSGTIELHLAEKARANANLPLREYRFVRLDLSGRPAPHWPLAEISGDIGQQLDLATGVVRPGGSLALESNFRSTDHLEFDLRLTHTWLRANAQDRTRASLLLVQQAAQLIGRLHLSVANELRLEAFRERDASATDPTTHTWATSLLFLHRTSWRSAWYVGLSRNDDTQVPAQHGWQLLAKWTGSFGN